MAAVSGIGSGAAGSLDEGRLNPRGVAWKARRSQLYYHNTERVENKAKSSDSCVTVDKSKVVVIYIG